MTTWTKMVAGVVVMGLAAGLYAQGGVPREGDKAAPVPGAFGKVVKLDQAAKTLTINGKMKREDDAKDLVFAITDETKVVISAGRGVEPKPATLADVTEGKNVSVVFRAGEDGKNPTALTIRIRPDGAGDKGVPKAGG